MLRLKFAPTVWLAFIVTVHVGPGLVQSPLQPMKVEPPSAPADRVTTVLVAYGWEQVLPHVIPGLSLVTLPVPLPGFCTLSTKPFRTVMSVENELFCGSGSLAMKPVPTDASTCNVPGPGGLTLMSTARLWSRGRVKNLQRMWPSVAYVSVQKGAVAPGPGEIDKMLSRGGSSTST